MGNNAALILVTESDVFQRSRLGAWLRERHGSCDVVEAAGDDEATRVLNWAHDTGRPVALAVIGSGVDTSLASRIARTHPAVRCIVAPAGEDDLSALEQALGEVPGIRVVGRRYGERTYAIKDFLYRNTVPFTWHGVDTPSGAALAAQLGLPEPAPTTVVLGDGTVLHDPGPEELATALGFAEPAAAHTCDLVIIGGGPAGLAAAVYGACEGLRVIVADGNAPGGQAGSTARIENYLGFPGGLTGADLAQRALEQARQFGVRWLVGHTVTSLRRCDDRLVVRTAGGAELSGKAVLVATGMRWRRLDAPGTDRFVNRGIYYGASLAEAAQTEGENVHVVGAGNSAGQAALYFADHARSLTLLVRGESLESSAMSRYLVDRIKAHPSITVRTQTAVEEVLGDDRVSGLMLRDLAAGRTEQVCAESVYVLIGMVPCTDWLSGTIALDPRGFVLTGEAVAHLWPLDREPLFTETSVPGVFAAGDVCAGTVKRVGAAVGQGAMAMHAIATYLRGQAVTIPGQPRRAFRQFDLLDADGNGHIEENDLSAVAQRLLTGFGEHTATERGRRVIAAYAEFWQSLSAIADADGDHRISRGEFEAATKQINDSSTLFRDMAEAVVSLCDTDDDGALNEAEFQRTLAILGVPIDDVSDCFRTLDTDGSGYLDAAEITVALNQFYAGAELRTLSSSV